jgi:HSP20 family molecular chaperone IbpA
MSFAEFGQGEGFQAWSQKIHDIMDEMLRRDFVRFRDSGTWQPATNVYESQDAYYVCVDLAGVKEQEIDVECADQRRITLTGTRAQPRPDNLEGSLSIHALEIDEGPFRREIDLPEGIDVDRVEATYSRGYLWITIPRLAIE